MPTYQAPVDDALFLINDVFHIERYDNVPGFADASPDLVAAVLEEAGKFCSEVLAPLNRIGDKQGCKRHDDGSVTTPEGFKDAFKRLVEGGWIGISCPPDFGGMGLPTVVNQLVTEFLASANMAFTMGLVHQVFADETFEQEVMDFCRHLAKQNGEQMGAAKIAIELAYEVGRDQARHVERLTNSALMLSPDYQEGFKRYLGGVGSVDDKA